MQQSWAPTDPEVKKTNLWRAMQIKEINSYDDFYKWSCKNREEFWALTIKQLKIKFNTPPNKILDISKGPAQPNWLKGALYNIAESCLKKDPKAVAIVHQREGGEIKKMTYGELDILSNQIANGLIENGFKKGDAIAIDMLMNVESVAIYLGIIKSGMIVVSIADSFAATEIASRLKIAGAKGVFTQDTIRRGGKELPMYEKVIQAGAPKTVVLAQAKINLRKGDLLFENFLSSNKKFETIACAPYDTINILFSSGTSGEPKAIPWTHLTPIKSAMDGHFHHDIQAHDIVAWPTNLGWMMGPWLVFASFINDATIALYDGLPTQKEFGEFVQNAQVSVLGIVPSIVKSWRNSKCMENLNWSTLKAFSSTGECSNVEDYEYLMSLAKNKPVVEYCGGTEIGGGYLTQTFLQKAYPSTFSTPSLGLEILILDEHGQPAQEGELFLIPPSIGLSQTLINKNHDEIYYQDCPKGPNGEILRRHGDEAQLLENNYYRALGRADDTMNLGGIKVSSVEIERTLNQNPNVLETAAIAINPKGGGPSVLVVFLVKKEGPIDNESFKKNLQNELSKKLNPLFKIHDLVMVDKLPRTASNKVMRRVLRAEYQSLL
ncbi:MAG: AMP-binding protein [Pseudomonadota bacterium]|nr:AMP-binding protein [Pseudomonadota bacterium]